MKTVNDIPLEKLPLVVQKFLKRKSKNRDSISTTGFEVLERGNKSILVKRNAKNKITHSACSYCHKKVKFDPFKYCAPGVYVFPICNECLTDSEYIELYLQNRLDKKGNKRPKRIVADLNKLKADINWELLEKLISSRQAKLGLLSKQYKVYNEEMKQVLLDRFGDKIEFKRGRGGGIVWSEKCQSKKK